MRTTSISTVRYQSGQVPEDPNALPRFLREELTSIAAAISLLARGHLDKTYVAPTKPRDGDLVYADGTSWNPGSGKGIYAYNGTTWILVKGL